MNWTGSGGGLTPTIVLDATTTSSKYYIPYKAPPFLLKILNYHRVLQVWSNNQNQNELFCIHRTLSSSPTFTMLHLKPSPVVMLRQYHRTACGSVSIVYMPLDLIGRHSSTTLTTRFIFRFYSNDSLELAAVLWLTRELYPLGRYAGCRTNLLAASWLRLGIMTLRIKSTDNNLRLLAIGCDCLPRPRINIFFLLFCSARACSPFPLHSLLDQNIPRPRISPDIRFFGTTYFPWFHLILLFLLADFWTAD